MNRELLQIYQQIIAPWAAGFNITITPLYFNGAVAGSEFLIYNVNKVYLYSFIYMGGTSVGITSNCNIRMHDFADVIQYVLGGNSGYYDAGVAAARFATETVGGINGFFSRITPNSLTGIEINCYRINRA